MLQNYFLSNFTLELLKCGNVFLSIKKFRLTTKKLMLTVNIWMLKENCSILMFPEHNLIKNIFERKIDTKRIKHLKQTWPLRTLYLIELGYNLYSFYCMNVEKFRWLRHMEVRLIYWSLCVCLSFTLSTLLVATAWCRCRCGAWTLLLPLITFLICLQLCLPN